MNLKTVFHLPCMAFLILLTGGCSSLDMKSTWLDRDLPLNSNTKDWPGGVNTLYGEKISLGASNNRDYLFLALVIHDSGGGVYSNYSHAIAATGLTTWIDPKGEDAWNFGVRLMGMEEPGFQTPLLEPSDDPAESEGRPHSLNLAGGLLEIINEKGNVIKTSAQSLRPFGFEARTSYTGDSFIYIMKIPLKPLVNSLFPATLATSKSVGIDFESGPLKIHKPGYGSVVSNGTSMVSSAGSSVSYGAGNTSNGITSGAGGTNNAETNDNPDQLSYWLSIDLATSP